MNSAKYVSDLIAEMTKQVAEGGIPLSEACWKVALSCVGWAYVFGARGEYCNPANRRSYYKSKGDAHPTIKTGCPGFDTGDCTGCKQYPSGARTRFFDCRGFTYWIILQMTGWKLMGAGATSQWNNADNWVAKGEVADGIPQGVIVCVFYYKKDKQGRRTSTLSHTGLYYNGQTVECSSGVQHGKSLNKKWEVWAVAKPFEAEYLNLPKNEPIQAPPAQDEGSSVVGHPTLRRGDKGDAVKYLQTLLKDRGYDLGKCGVDGDFGKQTQAALKQFQKDWGLEQDGVAGKKTWAMLLSTPERPKTWSVTVSGLSEQTADEIVSKYGGVKTMEG